MATAHPDHDLISSSDIENVEIYDRAGRSIGAVDHLMIEKNRGRVRYAVVSFGGFLGLGHSHYPIPWSALTYDPAARGFKADISEQQLRDAPEFSDDSWGNRDWEQRVHSHYGLQGYWSEPGAGPAGVPPTSPEDARLTAPGMAPPGASTMGSTSAPSMTAATASTGTELVSSEDVEDLSVYDRGGTSVGSVDHLMIDKRSGQVRFAVISFGGFLGLGESHFPVPWEALSYDPTVRGFRTDVTEQQLRDAPEFSDDSWQRQGWTDQVRQHYSRRAP